MTRFSRREYVGDVILNIAASGTAVGQFNTIGTVRYVSPSDAQNVEGTTTSTVENANTRFNSSGPILINPGNYLMAPWLSQIANFYEEYQLSDLVFEFQPLLAEGNAATAQVGSIIMAYQANVNAPAFSTKAEMLEHEDCMTVKSTQPFVFPVPVSKPYKTYFTSGYTTTVDTQKYATVGGVDCKTIFPGKMTIATQGLSGIAGQTLGLLYVSYNCTLMKEKYVSSYVPIGGRIN